MPPLESIRVTVERAVEPVVNPHGSQIHQTPRAVVGFATEAGNDIVGLGATAIHKRECPGPRHYFGIGSVTKLFTGLALAKAYTDGQVQLHNPVNNYLKPDLRVDDRITLGHLVTHTAGLPMFPDNLRPMRTLKTLEGTDPVRYSPGRNYSREMLAQYFRGPAGLVFEPGTATNYSSLGIGLLSVALQDHLGFRSLESLNRALVALPLGMADTHANTRSIISGMGRRRVQGYTVDRQRLHPVTYSQMGVLAGAGELISTANDMLQLLMALSGIRPSPLENAIAELTRPLRPTMGYAVRIVPSKHRGLYYLSEGVVAGFSAVLVWRRDPPLGLVLLANRGTFTDKNKLEGLNSAGLTLIEDLSERL